MLAAPTATSGTSSAAATLLSTPPDIATTTRAPLAASDSATARPIPRAAPVTKEASAEAMLDHFTQYVGSAPDASPAVLCSIASMQVHDGVWYPIGGTRAVPVALEQLARELGVELQPGDGVRRIVSENGRATGVETQAGDTVRCDAVVSNMDAVRTHDELIGGAAAERFRKRRGYEPACSGVVLYLGLDKAYGLEKIEPLVALFATLAIFAVSILYSLLRTAFEPKRAPAE